LYCDADLEAASRTRAHRAGVAAADVRAGSSVREQRAEAVDLNDARAADLTGKSPGETRVIARPVDPARAKKESRRAH